MPADSPRLAETPETSRDDAPPVGVRVDARGFTYCRDCGAPVGMVVGPYRARAVVEPPVWRPGGWLCRPHCCGESIWRVRGMGPGVRPSA